MVYDKFLIAPISGGQQKNVKPWLIMDDAFETLRNMYTWRGRVKKRFGSTYMKTVGDLDYQKFDSRLRVLIGTTDDEGNLTVTVPGVIFEVGQSFTADLTMFTVVEDGNPGDLLVAGSGTGTFDTNNGDLILTATDSNADVYYFPSKPVMNFYVYYGPGLQNQILFAFDTQFAYTFSYASAWQRSSTLDGMDLVPVWSGTDSQFYSTANYRGALQTDYILFVVNYNSEDLIWYFNGTDWSQIGTVLTTNTTGDDFIKSSLLISSFKNRLVMFNTIENVDGSDVTFTNRIRFSQNGSPFEVVGGRVISWRDDIDGRGGFIDIPVKQSITCIGFIKDRLIIYCEFSTWELVYTGNELSPFAIQQINSELGVESQNSGIQFDKVLLGFGSTGIHECNGINVDRVDETIPDIIFDVSNDNDGVKRTCGIRDYFVELAYWSFNSVEEQSIYNEIYPNRVLVYDYKAKTWAYNDDSITAFGTYQTEIDYTWSQTELTWEDSDISWKDPNLQSKFRTTIGGNQQGFTFLINSEINTNASVLYITDIAINGSVATITCINHNIDDNSYIYIRNISEQPDIDGNLEMLLNDKIFQVSTTNNNQFTIVASEDIQGFYEGFGDIERISDILVETKQYNFYNKIGQNIALERVDFLVDKTQKGQFAVDYYTSSSIEEMYESSVESGCAMGNNILETSPYDSMPYEQTQDRFWHYMYFNAEGENVQLRITYNIDQIKNYDVIQSDIEINAMLFYVTKTSENFGG